MHEKAKRARLLGDSGTRSVRNWDWLKFASKLRTGQFLQESQFPHFSTEEMKIFFFFLKFYQVAPTLLDVYGFPEHKAATRSDFMVCCSEIEHFQTGKGSVDRECWWISYLCAWGTRKNWVFEWAGALLVPAHEEKCAFPKEVSHNEHVNLFALKCICKAS